jgi:ribosomal-protein-alanine N-acetyltransferase
MTDGDVSEVSRIAAPLHMDEHQLRDELSRPWATIDVAREHGVGIVGFINTWLVVDELQILQLATRHDRRRCGIARRLLEDAIARARKRGACCACLETRRANIAALRLYEASGFATARIRKGYYPDGEDAVEMSLQFEPDTSPDSLAEAFLVHR